LIREGSVSWYEFLKFVHIVMAVIWVGGALAIQILAAKIQKESDGLRLASLSRDAGFLGERVFAPASGILLIAGILMVIDAWEFGDTFIIIGLIGWAATLVTGLFFLTPESKRVAGLMEQRGPSDPEALAGVKRLLAIARIDAIVLILVIFNMVVKPGL
jgi:uncharacterized membrane protein